MIVYQTLKLAANMLVKYESKSSKGISWNDASKQLQVRRVVVMQGNN